MAKKSEVVATEVVLDDVSVAEEVKTEDVLDIEVTPEVEAAIEAAAETVEEPEAVAEDVPAEPEKPAPARAERPRRAAKTPYTGPSQVSRLGSIIRDDNDLIVADLPVEDQQAEINEMKRFIRSRQVTYGTVFGVETSSDGKNVYMAVKRDTIRVLIPAQDFFFHSQMKDIEADSDEQKFLRYRRKGSHMLGAVVSFVPRAIGENDNGIPFVIGSRKDAMDASQEKHFFGPRADVKVGSMAKASIISVGPRYVTVECLGIEVTIGTGGLSAYEYIEDASEHFKTGQGLYVAVEKLEVDKAARTVQATLSHSLVERLSAKVETANRSMVSGRYMATVVATTTNYYIVIINGLKIRGLIPVAEYAGIDKLVTGDTVAMLVTGVNEEKNLVIGRCMKT